MVLLGKLSRGIHDTVDLLCTITEISTLLGVISGTAKDMLAARRKVRRRIRRIIMNDDGGDTLVNPDLPISRELYLSHRMFGIINTHVDSVFYCTEGNPYDFLFNELSDPQLLAELPRHEGESITTEKSKEMFSLEYWLKGGTRFLELRYITK